MRVWLYFIGKPRDAEANRMAKDYVRRTERFARIEMREVKPDRFDLSASHPAAAKILLDPAGKLMDSAALTEFVSRCEQGARDVVFLVGGADGLPPAWKTQADLLLSLTPLTLPHELARVVLAEQLYRAFATLRRHPYPR